MSNGMKRVLVALALALVWASQASAQTPEADVRVVRALEALMPATQVVGRHYGPQTLPAMMQEAGVPAVSIALIDDGRVAWARAYGLADVDTAREATPDTLFQAASISKPVAATAALTMVEDGLLSLDGSVNAGLTGWAIPDNALTTDHPVTMRHLLTHTAGLTVHGFPGYAPGSRIPTVEQVLNGAPPANTAAVVVDQTPGSAQRYSGGGFTVIQLLMTQAGAEPFPELMQSRVLRPAGMTASGYDQPLSDGRAALAATGYDDGGRAVVGRFHIYPELAAAGLWTTPTDLARWAIAIGDAFVGRPDAILGQETAQAMLTADAWGWGLGVAVTGAGRDLEFSHGGANEGYRCMLIALPGRRQGLVVMTNGDNGMAITSAVVAAIAAEYGWAGHDARLITPVPLSRDALSAFTGRYDAGDEVVTVAVSPDGTSLIATVPGDPSFELIPQGDDGFLDADGRAWLNFERDADGQVIAMLVSGQRLPRRLP